MFGWFERDPGPPDPPACENCGEPESAHRGRYCPPDFTNVHGDPDRVNSWVPPRHYYPAERPHRVNWISPGQRERDRRGLRNVCGACGRDGTNSDPLALDDEGDRVHQSELDDEDSGLYGRHQDPNRATGDNPMSVTSELHQAIGAALGNVDEIQGMAAHGIESCDRAIAALMHANSGESNRPEAEQAAAELTAVREKFLEALQLAGATRSTIESYRSAV